jgi:acyl-[acyl-carrier-protein]-phospholipid O-acyltransferase/long-chain-fatty-acid--[acyl-carrier-protein] ligase
MRELFRFVGFMPFLWIVFLNSAVDVAHKITLQNVLLKSFDGGELIILTALVNAMILLPFIFLFSPSGFIGDRFAKVITARYAAFAAILISLAITISYYMGEFYVAFGLTLLLSVQSAMYAPAKYGMIKELTGEDNLGEANGAVQAINILAILISSLLFSIVFEYLYLKDILTPSEILRSVAPIGWLLVVLSSIEWLLTFKMPLAPSKSPEISFSIKSFFSLNYLKTNMKTLKKDENVWLGIIGLSIFWGVGQLVLAAFPAHYKSVMGEDNAVMIQIILALSGVGVVTGSLLAGKYSRHHIELGIVPLGAVGLLVSLVIFAYATTIPMMIFASLLFGLFGGLFIVPLNALIQFFAPPKEEGTILAGSNFIQNIVMVGFLAFSVITVEFLKFDAKALFLSAGFVTLIGSLFVIKKIPHLFTRVLLMPILKTRYKLTATGIQNITKTGGMLLLGNHISFLDWLLLQVASPRPIKFVMAKSYYNIWYLRWFLDFFNVIPISSIGSKGALEAVKQRLNNGEVVAIFPEGRISYNGQMNEFKKGYELALGDTNHPIVPFYIHGLWGSTFSKANGFYKSMIGNGARRSVRVAFGKPMSSTAKPHEVKQEVTELSNQTWSHMIDNLGTLPQHWLRSAKSNLKKRAIVDSTGADLSNLKMITAVFMFSNYFKNLNSENIGVILPASAIGSIANMALMVTGKVPVNLNYTLSSEAMMYALDKASIKHIITSRKFVTKLESKGFEFSTTIKDKLIFAEDIGESFSRSNKANSLLKSLLLPRFLLEFLYIKKVDTNQTATILFSSGSEGMPKGVELTHKNIMANIKQVSALLNFQDKDVMLNSLPIFHSFGLTVTTLLPLCEGVSIISVPDPTDAVAVGTLAARHGATIMFGTSTFYRLYTMNRKLHPLMFGTIRMAVAGAEKLKPEVQKNFKEKFGLDIQEGYGATETSPVVSVNMPNSLDLDSMQVVIGNKEGTVGQGIPGTIIRIIDPQTNEILAPNIDGMILVGGSQVTKGYLGDPEKTESVIVTIDGIRYYKTGDKGHLDEDGFITIVDRYSRFAKIGGEMISLGMVEESIEKLFGDNIQAVAVALNDDKKGEQVALLFSGKLDSETVKQQIKSSEIIPLMQPSLYIRLDELPKLASGKTDFSKAKTIAMEQLNANS